MEEKLKELADRFKQVPIIWRLLVMFVCGTAYGFSEYFDKAGDLDQQIMEKQGTVELKKSEYNRMKNQLQNIAKLEEQLEFTRNQLDEVKKKLPDDFDLDYYLRDLAKLAEQTGVEIASFKPEASQIMGAEYKYEQLPISINIRGGYNQTATFLDRIVHFEQMVHLKNIKMVPRLDTEANKDTLLEDNTVQKEKAIRMNTVVNSTAQMLIYRSAANAMGGGASNVAIPNLGVPGQAPPAQGEVPGQPPAQPDATPPNPTGGG